MKLLTKANVKALLKNSAVRDSAKSKPVVKFFAPWGPATWLISELEEDGDTLFGLCDLGFGTPELGYVSLSELAAINGPFGLKIERDLHFTANKTLSEYADAARAAGRIVA